MNVGFKHAPENSQTIDVLLVTIRRLYKTYKEYKYKINYILFYYVLSSNIYN